MDRVRAPVLFFRMEDEMTVAEQANAGPSANLLTLLELPLAWAAIWSEFAVAALTVSSSAWTAFSKIGADIVGQAINVERIEAFAMARGLDDEAQREQNALKVGVERLTHLGEDILTDATEGPIFSLPD